MLYNNSEISAFQVTYILYFFTCIFNFCYTKLVLRESLMPEPNQFVGQFLFRCFIGSLGFTFFYFAMMLIEVSKAVVLYWTNPIWVMVLASVFLRERISTADVVAIVVTFSGVLILTYGSAKQTPADQTVEV